MAGGDSIENDENNMFHPSGYSLRKRSPLTLINSIPRQQEENRTPVTKKTRGSKLIVRKSEEASSVILPLRSSFNRVSSATTTPKSKITPTNKNIAVHTERIKHPSFFSPPRVLHEVPFLSPVTPSYKDFAGTDDVRLLYKPLLTLRYFWEGVCQCALNNLTWPWGREITGFGSFLLVAAGTVTCWALSGGYGQEVRSIVSDWCDAILEAAFWFGCGVLSTAGLGSGVQTGALILFPHVCKMGLAWAERYSDNNSTEVLLEQQQEAFMDLMWQVFIPGFWSGTGSAVGELVPYILARMIRAAGGDPFALLDESTETVEDKSGTTVNGVTRKGKSWTRVLLANTRSAMEGQMLESYAFVKIFILAAVPNGLFDLCGLVCGSSGVPFSTFFGAVWSGKALVRTPLQTCGLAGAVALLSLDQTDNMQEIDDDTPIRSAMLEMGRTMVSKFAHGKVDEGADGYDGEGNPTSLVTVIKMAWAGIAFLLFAFFILSTIEQIAQHHAKTLRTNEVRQRRMYKRTY